MKGVSQAVSAILLILIAASSAVLLEMFLSSHVSEAMEKTKTTPPLAPPTIQTVYQRDGKICVLIANPNNSDLNLVGRKLMVSREGEVLAITELNVVIPPRDFNVVCKEVSIPESGEYTITILTSPYPASATATLQKICRPNLAVVSLTYSPQVIYEGDTVTFEANICNNGDGDAAEFFVEFNIDSSEIDVVSVPSLTAGACTTVSTSWDATTHGSYTITALADYNDIVYESDESDNSESNTFTVAPPFEVVLSHGLTFSPPDSNRYDNVLFHGDYNRVYITIQGPPGTYTISSPCLEQVSCTIGGGETNCTVETNTTDANFSCEVTVSGPASTEMNVPVWYILFCNTSTNCQNDFSTALSYTDTNTIVFLTRDITNSYVTVPSGDYGWRVTFDGNMHTIDNLGGKYALRLDGVKKIIIKNVDAKAENNSLSLTGNSSVTIMDSNISAKNIALYVDWTSRIASATNAYCFFSGDPTPYPILSIDQSNYDLNISKYLEENAPGSPALCHVSVLADGVKIHDGNIGAVKDGNYLSSGAVVVHNSHDVNILRAELLAKSFGLILDNSSAVTIMDSHISSYSYTVYLDNSSATIQDSNIYATLALIFDSYNRYALYLSESNGTLKNSRLRAYTYTLYLTDSSSAALYNSYIEAAEAYNPLAVEDRSYISSATDSYCVAGIDSYPILALGPSEAGKKFNLYGNHYCHISIHHTYDIPISNGSVGGLGMLGAIVLYEATDIEIRDIDADARYYTIYLYNSSATLEGVTAQANAHALYLDNNSYVILEEDSNISTRFADTVTSRCPNCTNEVNIDLATGNVYVCSANSECAYDWYVIDGTLNVNCLNCSETSPYKIHTFFDRNYVEQGQFNVSSTCSLCNTRCP